MKVQELRSVCAKKTLYGKNSAKQESKDPVTRENNQRQQLRDKERPEPQFTRTQGLVCQELNSTSLLVGTHFPILNTWTP